LTNQIARARRISKRFVCVCGTNLYRWMPLFAWNSSAIYDEPPRAIINQHRREGKALKRVWSRSETSGRTRPEGWYYE